MVDWEVRNRSLEAIDEHLQRLGGQLDGLLCIIDDCIWTCEEKNPNAYLRSCAVTMLKGKRFWMCVYSLVLDGYAQEAGACSRPFLEYLEFLRYLRLDPSRHKLIPDKLPTAGMIAKEIGSPFKVLRQYLNEDASHKSFAENSIAHLVDNNKQLRLKPYFSEIWLKWNLHYLLGMLFELASESILAIDIHYPGNLEKQKVALEIQRAAALNIPDKLIDEWPAQNPSNFFAT